MVAFLGLSFPGFFLELVELARLLGCQGFLAEELADLLHAERADAYPLGRGVVAAEHLLEIFADL